MSGAWFKTELSNTTITSIFYFLKNVLQYIFGDIYIPTFKNSNKT